MKKVLLLFVALFSLLSAQAVTSIDEICGIWATSGTYKFNDSFDGSTWVDHTIAEAKCTIEKASENTVTITNLLGDDNVAMTGTVDLTAGTITIASPDGIWSYYSMFAADGESDPILNISEDGKTLTLEDAVLWYYGTIYGKNLNVTLSDRTEAAETTLLWTRNGQAWDSMSNLLGKVTVNAYSDGSYVVTDWQGIKGYDLKFNVNSNGYLQILNAYYTSKGYNYVYAGELGVDAITEAGLYTSAGYSRIYGPDWSTVVTTLDPEGGFFNSYCYAYKSETDESFKTVYSGYYSVTWGPDYTIELQNTRNGLNERIQGQSSQMTIYADKTDFTTTLEAFPDNYYILKNWQGVEGYDLKFSLNSNDSITVLNEDATEVVTSKGNRYWRVPTGRTDYDRACIYENSDMYNTFSLNAYHASITFGYSYLYPVGSNSGMKAYYSVKGFDPAKINTVSMRECRWDNEQSAYVDTVSFNTEKISQVSLYTIKDEIGDSTYYVVPDFMGPTTGDMYFTIDEEEGTANIFNIEGVSKNESVYYYYLHNDADYVVPGYFYTCYAVDQTTGEASLIIDMYYSATGNESDVYDTYYYIGMPNVATGISNAKAATVAKAGVSKYLKNNRIVIEKNGKKFSTTGVEIK